MATKSDVAGTIVNATMKLAATRGWRSLTLAAIAAEAGHKLERVYAEFPSKDAILRAFNRRIDAEMLKDEVEENASVRDRLFDLLMRRFEALTPHRAAIRAILNDTFGDPLAALTGLCAVHRSMALALEASGTSASGPIGRLRANALAALYLRTLYDWLQMEDGNDERIMARLDKALARAERIATSLADRRTRWRERRRAQHPSDREAGAADAPDTSEQPG
jgi:AcrR family transcriptional regulator